MKKVIEDIIFLSKESQEECFKLEDLLEYRRVNKVSAKVKPNKKDIKKMLESPKMTFCALFDIDSGGLFRQMMLDKLIYTHQEEFQISKELNSFFSRFDSIAGSDQSAMKSFGTTCPEIFFAGDNDLILDFVNQGMLPKFMRRFLVLSALDDNEHYLGTWLYDEPKESTEILALSLESMSVKLISHSFENFLKRGIECYKSELEQDYFESNEAALRVIRKIDGDEVYPDGQQYFFSFTEDWPEHWQEIASDT